MAGHVLVFRARGSDRLEVLCWDKDGYAPWYKRVEEGTFRLPAAKNAETSVELKASKLAMLLDGIDPASVKRATLSLRLGMRQKAACKGPLETKHQLQYRIFCGGANRCGVALGHRHFGQQTAED